MFILEVISTPKTCFIICPIGKEDTENRKNSDLFFKYIIQPITKEFGYIPIRADHMNESGMITFQIIDRIITSPLVIADLTSNNPNVFYELAVRHAMNKPCILMKTEGQETPFDLKDMRIISYDLRNLDKVEAAKKSLSEQIKNMENSIYRYLNPITLAYTYRNLARSLEGLEHAEDDLLTQVVGSITTFNSTVNDMKREVSKLNNRFNYLENVGIPHIFQAEGMTLDELIDKKISNLTSRLNELCELNKNRDDPSLRKQINEIKRQIRMEIVQKELVKKS